MDVRVGLWRRLSAKELMLLNCGVEKTLESPWDCTEIQPVHCEGDQPWDFFGRKDAKAETPVLWPPHAQSWLIGKNSDAGRDWGQEEKGTTEDEMAGWHHQLYGRESVRELVMDREAWCAVMHGLAKCQTGLSDWTELNWNFVLIHDNIYQYLSTSMIPPPLGKIYRTWFIVGIISTIEITVMTFILHW